MRHLWHRWPCERGRVLVGLNLVYTDKMSMVSSVEVRVPFLNDDLVELAARIPARLKLKRLQRKYIFKSQEGILPREIIWRPKAGFGTPLRSWLAKDLAPLMSELLSERSLEERGLIRPAVVPRMQLENSTGQADHALRLYALYHTRALVSYPSRPHLDVRPCGFDRRHTRSSRRRQLS